MTNDVIAKFIESGRQKDRQINIHFKTRKTITGVFIESGDYQELKDKNFWRIVSGARLEDWQKSKDQSLSRLFNGAEFTRLTEE